MSPAADPTLVTAEPLEPPRQVEQPLWTAVHVLLRCRHLVLAATALGTFVGVTCGLMRPNSFTSTGTLLLRTGARETESAEAAVGGRDPRDQRPLDAITNEIAILSHRDTFRRALEKVGEGRVLDVCDPTTEDTAATPLLSRGLHQLQAWWFAAGSAKLQTATPERRQMVAIKTLMTNLDVGALGSSIIRVRYVAHSPQLAKDITDAFLAAAEEHHREVFSNRTSLDFLNVMVKQASAAKKAAADNLLAFKREHGILDLLAERTAVMGDIARLDTQLSIEDQELQARERRCEQLRQLLSPVPSSTVPSPIGQSLPVQPFEEQEFDMPPLASPEYGVLQQELVTLRNQQVDAIGGTNDKTEMDRRVAELDRQIADAEERLRAMQSTDAPRQARSVKNPRYEKLHAQLDEEELKAAAARAANGRRAARLEELRSRLRELEGLAPQYQSLMAEIGAQDADSKGLQENLNKIGLLNLLDEHKLSNIRILEAGDLPMQKSGPKRGLWTLIGATLGFVTGLGAAFARYWCDGAVRRPRDLQAAGIAVLGVVPELAPDVARQLGQGDVHLDARQQRAIDSAWGELLPVPLPRTHAVTIAMVGDQRAGVTSLSLQFAVRLARRLHVRVLLVETNCQRPALAARLADDSGPGFAELIGGNAGRDDVLRQTAVPGLRIVHAGAKDLAGRGHAPGRQEELLRSLIDGFQIVLLDVPSIVEYPQHRPLVAFADSAVPVFAAGSSTKEGVRALLQAIESTGKVPPGAILNRWRSVRPSWLPKTLNC